MPTGKDESALAARTSALRSALVTLAFDVARIEDEMALAYERKALMNSGRATERRERAAAARRFADHERVVAGRFDTAADGGDAAGVK